MIENRRCGRLRQQNLGELGENGRVRSKISPSRARSVAYSRRSDQEWPRTGASVASLRLERGMLRAHAETQRAPGSGDFDCRNRCLFPVICRVTAALNPKPKSSLILRVSAPPREIVRFPDLG
jgi:hypothetical protein